MIESYPPVLIAGNTGTGKSSCLRNVANPERVAVLNIERKIMPSRNAMKLKSVDITSYKMLLQAMKQAMDSDDYDMIFVDSFSALGDLLHRYCKSQFSGYEIWGQYNDMLYEFLQSIKSNKKPLYITGIPETLEVGFDHKQYIRVKGKEFRYGGVESNFAVVLFTDPYLDEESGQMKFRLKTNPNMMNSAKSPEDMFPEFIDNDTVQIQDMIEKYYSGDE